jgi:hypothetical protein
MPATTLSVRRESCVPLADVSTTALRAPAIASSGAASSAQIETSGPLGQQARFRSYARLSLPRVYGLAPAGTIIMDRELFASTELGQVDGGLFSRLRAGVGVGQTQFGMVFHTNTGGQSADTIIEQSPQAFYARAFIAPELVRFDSFSGLLEVGGGYAGVGGFGTVGINLEYRPVDAVAFQIGASSWLLPTSYRGGFYLSTNVNAHLGAVIGF